MFTLAHCLEDSRSSPKGSIALGLRHHSRVEQACSPHHWKAKEKGKDWGWMSHTLQSDTCNDICLPVGTTTLKVP